MIMPNVQRNDDFDFDFEVWEKEKEKKKENFEVNFRVYFFL